MSTLLRTGMVTPWLTRSLIPPQRAQQKKEKKKKKQSTPPFFTNSTLSLLH